MKNNKIISGALCFSLLLQNIVPVFAKTEHIHSTDEVISHETEVIYNKSASYFVSIPKTIVLDENKEANYSIKVDGDIPSDTKVYVSPVDQISQTNDFDFYMKDQSSSKPKTDVMAKVLQNKFCWNFEEAANADESSDNKIIAKDLTAGEWKGTFDFEINMKSLIDDNSTLTLSVNDTVAVGTNETIQVIAYLDGQVANDEVIWHSDNENITVDNGIIETKASAKIGDSATITVFTQNKTNSSKIVQVLSELGIITEVNAENNLITSFNVTIIDMVFTSPDETTTIETIEIIPGNSKDIEVTIIPASVSGTVSWSSTAPSGLNLIKNGNKATVKIADDMEINKSYFIIATYGGYSKVLTVNIVPEHTCSYTEEITTEVTCTTDGLKTFTCECGDFYTEIITKLGHNYQKTIKEENCIEDGLITYTCECGDSYYETITKLGHNYKETIVSPTHKEQGYTLYECIRCMDSYKDNYIDAIEHTYTETITTEATCITDGLKTFTCGCGNSYTEIITKLGHNFNTKYTIDVEATCTTVGSKSQHCTRCISKTNVTEIPMLEHTYSSSFIKKEPTCIEDGIRTYVCENCGNEKIETLTKLDHSYTDIVVDSTHTEQGYTLHQCNNCEYNYKDTYVDAIEHTYTETITTEVSCTTDGLKTFTCECGYSYTELIAKLGHNYSTDYTVDVQPTCTTVGSKSQYCTRCNTQTNITEISALGHSYEYTVTTMPTCTTTGVRTYTCTECSNSYVETIEKLAHAYEDTVLAPTCTEQGYTLHSCIGCSYSYKDTYVNAIGHTIVNEGTSGVHQKCSVCGTTSTTHSYTVDSGIQYSAATCTQTRYNYKKCACGYNPKSATYVVATGSVNSSNHTGSAINGGTSGVHTKYSCCGATISTSHNYTVDSGVQYSAATCIAKRKNYKKCTCGYNPKSTSYVVETGSVNSSNHTGSAINGGTSGVHTKYSCCGATISTNHSYTVDSGVQYSAATCTAPRYNYKKCACGYNPKSTSYIVATGSALGHSSTYGGTSGVHTKCSRCGITLSTTHTIKSTITAPSSCISYGTRKYYCACGYYYYKDDVEMLAHSYNSGAIVGQMTSHTGWDGGIWFEYTTYAANVNMTAAICGSCPSHYYYIYPTNYAGNWYGTRTKMSYIGIANSLYHYRYSETLATAGKYYYLFWEDCDSIANTSQYWTSVVTRYTCTRCGTYYDVKDRT